MISVFINSMTSGGAERIVLTIVEKLISSGKKVDLFLIEKELFYELPAETTTHYLSPHETLDKKLLAIPYLLIGALRLKKQLKDNQHPIVQSHLPRANMTNILAQLLGSKHASQLVIHSTINFDKRNPIIRFFAKTFLSIAFRRADSLVFISRAMQAELNKYFDLKHPKNQIVIPNPHIIKDLKAKAKQTINDFDFKDETYYLIFAGRIDYRKRLEDLLLAFEQISTHHINTELIVLGDGEDLVKLKSLSVKLEIDSKVHLLGYRSNPYPYIAQSDCLILCSETEGLPNILIEAMACGTPVVSSDCISGPREIISPKTSIKIQLKSKIEEAEYGILFPVGNIPLMTKAIEMMLFDEEKQKEYTKAGLERANEYDASKIIQRYLAPFQ